MRPEWNLHFLVAIEALEVLSCNSESPVWLWFCNGQISRWFRSCVIDKGFLNKLVLAFGIHIENLRFIFAISILVVTGFSCYSIRTICLTTWSVPDDVFHPIGMRPEWNLHFFITIQALKILSRNGEGAVWLWFCNSQICRNWRFLLRNTLISCCYHSCACAIWCATSYHSWCWLLWYNLVASAFVRRLVITKSQCDRCHLCCNGIFCLNTFLNSHSFAYSILRFWWSCCCNDSWCIFWCLIGRMLLIGFDLLCRKSQQNGCPSIKNKIFLLHVSSLTIFYTDCTHIVVL